MIEISLPTKNGWGWPQNSNYFASAHFTQYHSLTLLYCLKNKRMGFDSGNRLDLCMCVCVCVYTYSTRSVCTTCACIRWRSGDGDMFYKERSCQEAIVCGQRWQGSNPAMDGILQMKTINKNGAIVSEALNRISAGVWGQSGPHNSLSTGKHICYICLAGKQKTQMDFCTG